MADSRQRTLVSVRATCSVPSKTKVYARSASGDFGVPFSFDRAEPNLTGAESLLGLLAADIAGLFANVAKQRRLAVDRVEVIAKVELCDSLKYLGVIGAQGKPSYDDFQLKFFVDSPEAFGVLQDAWHEAIERAPLFNTIKGAARVEVEMVLAD